MKNVYVVVFVQAGLWHCSLESHLSVSTPTIPDCPERAVGQAVSQVHSEIIHRTAPGMFPLGAGGMLSMVHYTSLFGKASHLKL